MKVRSYCSFRETKDKLESTFIIDTTDLLCWIFYKFKLSPSLEDRAKL